MIANRLRVNLEELQEKTGHPKWRQVDLNASLPGWERYDCVSKYLDTQVVEGKGRSCSFGGGARLPESVQRPETTADPKCNDKNLDNPIVRSLCKNLQKLQQ